MPLPQKAALQENGSVAHAWDTRHHPSLSPLVAREGGERGCLPSSRSVSSPLLPSRPATLRRAAGQRARVEGGVFFLTGRQRNEAEPPPPPPLPASCPAAEGAFQRAVRDPARCGAEAPVNGQVAKPKGRGGLVAAA